MALGLLAALVTARAFWPSEFDPKAEGSNSLDWDFAILLVGGLAIASALISGALRVRWSWTDAAVVGLMFAVGVSTTNAHDRRAAINLAWDWAAIGVAYVLYRNLPRTRGESTVLAGALMATAVAVSAYGLYQVGVELPQTRAYYLAHRAEFLAQQGIRPGSTSQAMYENRLLQSNEPMSTFALPNSLAGFIVGPLVLMLAVGWENAVRRWGRTSRLGSLALAIPPALVVLICLVLTKSRSAWIGMAVALGFLAWRERRRVSRRTLALTALGAVVVIAALVVGGLKTGRLDRLVLTESTKSLRYRWEYWVGAWRVITAHSQVFWGGHGPGNFAAPYLKHKLPQASEEILDPHNMILEVWAAGGASAMALLVSALLLGFWNLLAPAEAARDEAPDVEEKPRPSQVDPADPPRGAAWLVASAGLGWIVAAFLGDIDPFRGGMLYRWLILGVAWLWAILFGVQLWRRLAIPPLGLGAGALAIAINLLAAGGIGMVSVALMFWLMIALGLNLRDDRDCGRLRGPIRRLQAFGLALVWASLVGSFAGAIRPFWESERAIAEAEAALNARPPQFERADKAYQLACDLDKYSNRPWLGLAFEKYMEWQSRGSKIDDQRWRAVPLMMTKAVMPPRNPDSWRLHYERATVLRDLLKQLGSNLKPLDLVRYRGSVVEATRQASRLYPTNPNLHAALADASAEAGVYQDAVKEAQEALRFDGLTPHLDKKLPQPIRKHIEEKLPEWEKAAKAMPLNTSLPGKS